ncbi:sigma factor-like helix-turn-helix DNA-binding protein [Oceanobacillus senegalensis]
MNVTEIGSVLGLTTSRISQIHKRAINKLKDILDKL